MKNESTQDLDKIHDFLRNQLSEKEEDDFQKQIAENEEMKEAVTLSENIDFVLKHQALFEVNQYIKNLQKTEPPTFPQKKKNYWKWITLITMMVGIGLFFVIKSQMNPRSTIDKARVVELLNLYDYSVSFTDELNQQGQQAFEERKYGKAIQLFEQTLSENEDKNVRLLWGIAKLRSRQEIKNTIIKLEILEQNAPSYMKSYVWWYLGLAYLENEEMEKAALQFNRLQGIAPFGENIPLKELSIKN